MSVFGASVQRTNLEILSLLTSNTPTGITNYIECSAMQTPRQPMPKSRRAKFTEDSTCSNIFRVLWATSPSLTFSIQCRCSCLTTSRSGLSTLWWWRNGSTSTMRSGYLCLLTLTWHQNIWLMKKFLNGMGRRWQIMTRYLLGVVTQSLCGGRPAQHPIFNHAIVCTLALLVVYMYPR